MSKEPAARYRTADQLGRILQAYRESGLQNTGPVSIMDLAPVIAVYEQPTALFPSQTSTSDSGAIDPVTTQPPPLPRPVQEQVKLRDGSKTNYLLTEGVQEARDWGLVALGILAVISLLGLIPLWYFVYVAYRG
jgi:hypothetical protein